MLLNDTKADVKTLLIKDNITQVQVSEKLGTSKQYVNRTISQKFIISKSFLNLLEAIGYDIRIEYVKRQ